MIADARNYSKPESFKEVQGKYMNKISPPKRRYSALKKQMEDSLSMWCTPSSLSSPF